MSVCAFVYVVLYEFALCAFIMFRVFANVRIIRVGSIVVVVPPVVRVDMFVVFVFSFVFGLSWVCCLSGS